VKKAKELWTWIEPFAAYGFNKAHSVSYGRVAYQTAYFKANFPAAYMANVLTGDSGDVEKIAETITECKRMNIPVLPPSVNESFEDFSVVPNDARTPGAGEKIRFGLKTIKNFGDNTATFIIEERKRAGKFKSLSDFLGRIGGKNLNRKSLEALVKAGALDEFADRGAMFGNLEMLLEYNKEKQKQGGSQDSLFGGIAGSEELHLSTVAHVTQEERLAWEKELLGLYISGHPLEKYRAKLEKRDINIAKVKEKFARDKEAGKIVDGALVVLGGIIEEARTILTKKNDEMCFLRVADLTGSIETVVFPRTYARYKGILKPDTCIAMKAKVSERNGELSLAAESFMALQ
jgi:DNA polymerase-3 subunit alpha